ncbi:MAG TPA: hypothetical protein VLH86_00865 [Patescibacteria group bacterium]|nr:hypothetical protein [Patescibacteria group bacterium]
MFINRHTHTKRSQAGDTIVEVLISITVISLILGGAYVTTNKSLIATRSAQERGNSLKLAESQLEQIKGVVATNPNAIFGGAVPSPFCVYANAGTLNVVAATNANCTVNTAGAATTTEPKFKLSVTRSGNDFTIKNTWNDLSGNVTDNLQLKYRIYP